MSISPVGNSDAYARYRQQALDLLASPSQTGSQTPQTTAPSYTNPADTSDESSSTPFATKFTTDLSMLNSADDKKSHAHGAHGHHHSASASTDAKAADATSTTADPLGQSLDEFANLLKTAVGIAALIA